MKKGNFTELPFRINVLLGDSVKARAKFVIAITHYQKCEIYPTSIKKCTL